MKRVKGVISVFLVAALLACCACIPASAEEDLTKKDLREYPVINMAGSIGPLYFNEDGEDGEEAFDFGWLTTYFSQVDLMTPLKKLDLKGVIGALGDVIKLWFGDIQMYPDGTSKNDISRRQGWHNYAFNWRPEEDHTGEMAAWYAFDWRGDPFDEAEKLDAYIDLVLAKTGAEKVNLVAISGSGQIAMAYLARYPAAIGAKLASVVFNISLHNGNTAFGQLATGKMRTDSLSLGYTQLFAMMDMPDIQNQFAAPLKWLYETGVLDIVASAFNVVTAVLKTDFYNDVLIPYIFTLPNMWNYVPTEYYEEAKNALFADKPEYADFLDRSDRYHDVMVESDHILQEAAKKIKVALWAGYGMPLMPFGNKTDVQSDSFVDTRYASNGATCADLDCPFPCWYKQKEACCDGSHVSPDRMIDASTCALPDQTWFSKNEYHQEERNYSGWYQWFLETDNVSVFEDERYPQFMEMVTLHNYEPVKAKEITFLGILKDIGYFLLKVWRFVIGLPLIWTQWI